MMPAFMLFFYRVCHMDERFLLFLEQADIFMPWARSIYDGILGGCAVRTAFYMIGKRVWHYGKSNHYITPTDFFDDNYHFKP
jgi:hypothetical protein